MDMNGIDGAPPKGNAPNIGGVGKNDEKQAHDARKAGQSDRVELSDQARRLLTDNEDIESAREIVMDAARRKMLTGDLLNGDALRRAAEKLLDSGDLDKAGDA